MWMMAREKGLVVGVEIYVKMNVHKITFVGNSLNLKNDFRAIVYIRDCAVALWLPSRN